jgi:hypothetical protein
LGIHSDNWSDEWKFNLNEIKDFPLLIITHKRYIDLCLDEELRQYFIEDRGTLIIDEKIEFPIYFFSKRHTKTSL